MWRELIALVCLGVVTQVGGVLYVFGMGRVGVAIAATLQMGVMLLGSVVLGRVFLSERPGWRAVLACALITLSMVFFNMGAGEASESMRQNDASQTSLVAGSLQNAGLTKDVLLAIGAVALSGMAFAILTVGVRKTVTSNTAPEVIVLIINAMGLMFLGPWAWQRLGLHGLMQTSGYDFAVMLAAGAFNLAAFFLLTLGLKRTSLVRINAINNVVTTALTAVAGIMFFAEPATAAMMFGIALTIIGILLIGCSDGTSE